MARGFGTTYGVGTTDVIQTNYAGLTPSGELRSLSVWLLRNGIGGGGIARIFQKGTSTTASLDSWYFNNSNSRFTYDSGAFVDGANQEVVWTWTPTDTLWHHLVFAMNTSIQPGAGGTGGGTAYFDGVAHNLTTQGTGTSGSTTEAYVIGNREDGLRNWDGMLADLAMWDGAQLTQTEAIALATGARPYQIRPGNLSAWWPMDGYMADWLNRVGIMPSVGTGAINLPGPNIPPAISPGSITGTKLQPNSVLLSTSPIPTILDLKQFFAAPIIRFVLMPQIVT
jgi:hypothetical protein